MNDVLTTKTRSSGGPLSYPNVKRVLDVGVACGVTAIAIAPIGIACAAICIESRGLPVFRQERIGQYGKPFRMWKLRTMYVDAEDNIEKYLSPEQLFKWQTEHKVDEDPRITRVGRVLRKTSLDELPQFLNVIAGEMSIVGPRPVTKEEIERYGSDAEEILQFRPGITGYWQAFARNDATWESGERQAMELFYVRNVSMKLDAKIFLRTFGAVIGLTGR